MTTLDRSTAATAAEEEPVFIPAARGDLLAIVTRPATAENKSAAVLLRGGGWRPSSGPRRTQVRLARRLAGAGLHAVRFSYHGVAESSGKSEEVFRLDQPFVDDVDAVAAWVAARDLRPILVGNCFGARTALSYAAHNAGVAGLALIVPPVHDFEVARRRDRRPWSQLARRATPARVWAVIRNKARRRAAGRTARAMAEVAKRRVGLAGRGSPSWLSRGFCRELATVLDRGVPVVLIYGEADPYYRDFEIARAGELAEVVTRAGDLLVVEVVEGRIHGLTTVQTQEATLDAIERWVVAMVNQP